MLKYDFIYDSLKVICNKNLERPRNFNDIDTFGDMGTESIFAKNREFAKIFFGNIGPPI